ncbi:transposon TX1 uncharacterized [Tanacetum coccineum]
MWDSRVFNIENKTSDSNFLAVMGSWAGSSSKVELLYIYAPQASALKEQLWSSIEAIVNANEIIWILFGDFNVVRHIGERVGSLFDAGEANTFNDFISRTGLFDFPMNGRRLQDLTVDEAVVSALCRSYSDHCPIMLHVVSQKFGPKPFKVFNKWIGNEDFLTLISSSWSSIPSLLPPDLATKNKIKKLRLDIKSWTLDKISAQNKVREDLKRHLMDWDTKAEAGLINDGDIAEREEWIIDLYHLDHLQREDLNSNIKGIYVNGIWLDDPDEIKREAADYFSSRFKEPLSSRPAFNSSSFRKLSDRYACFLESSITVFEIKEAVWGCAGSKDPGPDGFNFNFIKAYRDILKDDFVKCIKHFEASGKIANGCNPSFIVLIPKKSDPLGFSDYRPISLIGRVYKIISKILANRLEKVIALVIGPNQSAFIARRKILDGCLIANEIIRMASLEKTKLLLFKVDFDNAFDSVNWCFLHNIMRQMGFGIKWRMWIDSCLSSASISTLVNGSPTKEFKMERVFIKVLRSTFLKVSLLAWESPGARSIALPRVSGALISEFYGEDGGFCSPSSSLGIGGLWCDILKAIKNIETIDPSFKDSFVIKVGNGNNILFWRDPWCSTGLRPMDIFPRLFALDTYKDCKVCDRWGTVNGVWGGMWSWRVPPRDRSLDDIRTLSILIGDLRLLESENDKWTWSSDVSSSFKVKTLTKKIERHLLNGSMIGEHHVWNSWIPRKVNICT